MRGRWRCGGALEGTRDMSISGGRVARSREGGVHTRGLEARDGGGIRLPVVGRRRGRAGGVCGLGDGREGMPRTHIIQRMRILKLNMLAVSGMIPS